MRVHFSLYSIVSPSVRKTIRNRFSRNRLILSCNYDQKSKSKYIVKNQQIINPKYKSIQNQIIKLQNSFILSNYINFNSFASTCLCDDTPSRRIICFHNQLDLKKIHGLQSSYQKGKRGYLGCNWVIPKLVTLS